MKAVSFCCLSLSHLPGVERPVQLQKMRMQKSIKHESEESHHAASVLETMQTDVQTLKP